MVNNDKYIQFSDMNNDGNIIHLYTKNVFDFNLNNLSKNYIDNEYDEISKMLNCTFDKIITAKQTHTNNVVKITKDNINDNFENVDGLITNVKNIALVTYSADCQLIFLYDKRKKIIGNIHSGWRGTASRIIKNAINIMIEDYNSDVADICAYICPSILSECYAVGKDVRDIFIDNFSDINIENYIKKQNDDYMIDLVGINVNVLMNLGIKRENIYTSDICTKCNEEFHSYRRDREKSGRNIALIMLI